MPKTKVFVSYSHKDRRWLEQLSPHLAALSFEGLLDRWDDRRCASGDAWRPAIEKAMDEADVALLLVSADFLASRFIAEEELPRLLARRAGDGLPVFPVIVRPCTWLRVERLATIQARPRDGKTLSDLEGAAREREWVAIAEEILALGAKVQAAREAASGEAKVAKADSEGTLPRGLKARAEPLTSFSPTRVHLFPSLPIRPHQLPAPPSDFVGREDELAELEREIRRRASAGEAAGAAITGLRGMGGVGKTALALVLANRILQLDLFPGGEVYLDLRGHEAQTLRPEEVMAHTIHAFAPEAKIPGAPAEVVGLYRTILTGRRALLLLDNVARREQVEPLVPPPGNLLLTTSRQRFSLPGQVAKDLDQLPPERARELLLSISPRLEPEVDRVAKLCGYLPFALRLSAGSLAEEPGLTIGALRRRLEKAEKRAEIGERVLGVSYELLGETLQERWQALEVFPASFEAEAVAAIWEAGQDEAEEALGELVRRSLVEGAEGRYRLHDLARDFATARSSEEGRESARLHLARYCVELAWRLDGLYKRDAEGVRLALARFDQEWANVSAAWEWLERRAGADREIDRLCSDLPNAADYLLALRLYPRERIRWCERALEAARRLGDREQEGYHLNNLGMAYAALGEPRRAIEHYEQRLAIAREIGDRRAEGSTLGNMGNAYMALGEPARAIEQFEECLAIAREIEDPRVEGTSLGNLGNAYLALREPSRAIDHYEKHLATARELGDRRGEANALGNLGHAHAALGEPCRAIEHYGQCLAIAQEIGDRSAEGATSWNMGLVYKAEGDLARAVELMQVLVDFEREIGHADAEKDAASLDDLRARLVASRS